MSPARVSWRPAPDSAAAAVQFASRPSRASSDIPTELDDLLAAGAVGGGSGVVSLPALFAENLKDVRHVPHPYIHLAVASARDGSVGEASSTEAQGALETSIYEVMERYLGAQHDPTTLAYGSYQAMGPDAVDPRDLVLLTDFEYERAQQPFARYAPDLPIHWAPGYQIVGNRIEQRYLPATLSILKFSWTRLQERFAPSLSPGTASGRDLVSALLHATYELIERDAFIRCWLERRAGVRLEVQAFPDPQLSASLRQLRADGYEATFLELTTSLGIPVVLGVIRRPGSPYWAFGMGANVQLARAAERAYSESLEMLSNYYDFSVPGAARAREMVFTGGDLDLPAYYESCRFLIGDDSRVLPEQVPEPLPRPAQLRRCLDALTAYGAEVYFVDLTPAEMGGDPYRLVRVLASRLQPHIYELDCWRLGNPLLPADPAQLNLVPNPFAVLDSSYFL